MNANPYNLPLTQPQRARLERARDGGELNGVRRMYHVLRSEMGPAATNKNQISTFMRALLPRPLWFVDMLHGNFTRLAVVLNRIGQCSQIAR